MNFQMIEDWERVLKRAWSIKFTLLAMVFGGGEAAMQYFTPDMMPHGILAALSLTCSLGAGFSRLLAQQLEPNAAAAVQEDEHADVNKPAQ